MELSYRWHGKSYHQWVDEDTPASYTRKIEGRRRMMTAAYLVLRDGNRCAPMIPGICLTGETPFEHPESADFDHIRIREPPDHRLRNLRLACHNCNSHLQWKQRLEATSPGLEREKAGSDRMDRELPTVVRINLDNRPLYAKLLGDYIDQHQEISVYDATFMLARKLQEKTGNGSPQACSNYLKTLTAGDDSPFIATENKVRRR